MKNVAEEGIFYTSHESLHIKLPEGKWWLNITPLGEKPLWIVSNPPSAKPVPDNGLIFGYTWEQIDRIQQRAV